MFDFQSKHFELNIKALGVQLQIARIVIKNL